MDLGRIFRVVPGFVVPVNVGATETQPWQLVRSWRGLAGSRVGLCCAVIIVLYDFAVIIAAAIATLQRPWILTT